jgi:hypothetical protein
MVFRTPWDEDLLQEAPPPLPEAIPVPPKKRGRRPAAIGPGDGPQARSPGAGGWLYHHLTIIGPADRVAAFAEAAKGAGIVPWRIDGARIEEDIFNLAVSQPKAVRSLTVEGCRILARQFRDRVEAHQARAAAEVGRSLACPFDLYALLPVPDAVLQLGSAHPTALAWLAAHWGVTDRLRQVTLRAQATAGRRLPRGHTVIGYGFFTLGETPQAAIDAIAARWPGLRFALTPRPAN